MDNDRLIEVTIYEDKKELREGLSMLIQGTDGLNLRGAFPNCDKVETQMEHLAPDVVLMDIDMPGIDGIEGLRRIKTKFPKVNVVMLTVFDDDDKVFEAVLAGANGYLLKKTQPARILEAIVEVYNGSAPMTGTIARKVLNFFNSPPAKKDNNNPLLTAKESEILSWLVKGYSYKMIASQMNVTVNTVGTHIKNIYAKLHVNSMSEAVARAIRQKIV